MAIIQHPHKNVEVAINQENGKAVIQGKTSIPFKMFVSLILQRKVQVLFKDAQNEPVIVSSELLTKLASAPDDKMEDRSKLVTVTLGVGILCGVFISACILLLLQVLEIIPRMTDLLIVIGVFVALAVLATIMQRAQGSSMKQKIYDRMEKVTEMISK